MSVAIDNETRALGRVGQVLKEKYRLDALLGIGGMAAVFAATHRNAKRVAIKMLLPELANDQEVRGRFVREGYAANTIEHPGALSVLDDDVSEDGLPYLVMELLEGETVEAKWQKGGQRLELAEVLMIAGALLDVLGAAHTKGIVHRDIKPENLFLVRGGGLKVLDFGIARVLEATMAKQTSTRAGTVMGTPAFMAPEQALAKWDEVDGRTDLWAVGATMFTLLTGQHVHEGETGNEQLIKSATQPARSIASVVKGLPRSVVALVDRALAFERTQRWPDAKTMAEAVAGSYEALTGSALVVQAPPMSAVMSPRRSSSGEQAVAAPPRSAPGPNRAPPGPPPPARMSSGQMRAPTMPSAGGAPPPRRPSASNPGTGGKADESVLLGSATTRAAQPVAMESAGGLAPPTMAALSVDAYVTQRNAEKEQAGAELARHQATVTEIQARLAIARKKVAAVQEQIAAARKERADGEEKFRRQMNARLEGIGEARKGMRKVMSEVARIALADAKNFPAEFGAAERAEIDKTRGIAESRERESALHDAAVDSYDKPAMQRGLALAIGAFVLFLILFFSPVVIRSCSTDTGELSPGDTTDTPP